MCHPLSWDTSFHGISVHLEDKIARIKTDDSLLSFLAGPEIDSLALADYILARYLRAFGKPLAISRDSLAIEILAHVFVDQFAGGIGAVFDGRDEGHQHGIARLMEKVQARTDVIDCGEASVDSNRPLWDALVPLRRLVYALFGERA